MEIAIETTEFMTPSEKAVYQRQKEIAKMFQAIAPECIGERGMTPERVFRTIADKFGMSIPGVKASLQREGLYTTNADIKEQYTKKNDNGED